MSVELRALLAVAVIAVLGWVGYQLLFSDSGAVRVVLYDVHGSVSVESGGVSSPAAVGGQIGAADRLVSGADGGAVLAFGDQSRVTLEPNTSVQVTSVDSTGVRLSLEDGRVKATVRAGGPSLGVAAGGRSISAKDADFTVAKSGDGVGVETSRGRVAVDGTDVAAGKRAVYPKDGSPLQMPASETLLLQVAWPSTTRTAAPKVEVTGTAEPGARLAASTAAGTAAAVAAKDGTFSFQIPLGEGDNTVNVVATNVFGQVSRAQWQVSRDSRPPSVGVTIQ